MEFPEFLYPENKTISWTVVIIFAIICGIIVLYRSRSRQKEFEMRKQYFYAGVVLIFSYAAIRFMFMLSDFENWNIGKTLLHFQLVYMGYIFLYTGFYFIVAFYDKYFLNSYKLIISKIYICIMLFCVAIFFALPLLLPYEEITRYIFYSGIYYVAAIAVIIILKVLLNTSIKGLVKFLWGFIGIVLMLLAGMLESYFPLPIVPVIVILGMILIAANVEITIKLLSEYYTSKKICLIHRGKIVGKRVFCPQCFAQYCDKCYNSVISIENKCWLCEYEFAMDLELEASQKSLSDQEEEKLIEGKEIHKK